MLKHGILGLINYDEKTGYEIMTVFRQSLGYFWTAQTSQIYRELQTMEKAGWISVRHVEQSGRPDKNVFSITEEGRAELVRWLREDNLPEGERSPLLLKTFFLGECTPEENIAFFRRLQDQRPFPDGGEEVSQTATSYQRELAEKPERALYWRMTIRYAQMYEQMIHDWCDMCIRDLESLSGTEGADRHEETL